MSRPRIRRHRCGAAVLFLIWAVAMPALSTIARAQTEPDAVEPKPPPAAQVVSPSATPAPPADLTQQVDTNTRRLDRITWIGGFLLAAAGLSLGGAVVSYLRLLRWAERHAQKVFRRELERKPAVLAELIDERSADNRLKRETPVAVIAYQLALSAVLQQHGFRKVETRSAQSIAADDLDRYGAVVFDLSGVLTHEEALSILQAHGIENALGFSPQQRRDSPLIGRCTFANSHITLYWRLLELFKFQEAARRS